MARIRAENGLGKAENSSKALNGSQLQHLLVRDAVVRANGGDETLALGRASFLI